jgi:hypothetical protein
MPLLPLARRRPAGALLNPLLWSVVAFVGGSPAPAAITLSSHGRANCAILRQVGATEPEIHAASELKVHLDQITGAQFANVLVTNGAPDRSIIVGPGPLAQKYFPEVDLARLSPEELVMRTKGSRLLLAGGRPRGTLYAVNRFLQEECGIRWWTPWATNVPHRAGLRMPELSVTETPAFEYRGDYWFVGFDPLWKTRNGCNNESGVIPAALGGCIEYKGFCHTFYPLVPPEKYYAEHPEWYSLINGKRTHERAQLCLTNPKLRDFVVEQAKTWLRASPEAQIISITQNDWFGACECPDCKAIDDAEGSHAGTMITFANYIAEKIEPEFPQVAVDTFAYQYTRTPPKTVKPRHNVIVRLCSIECNFREPLSHPSNVSFASDIRKWSEICRRLYVWDYVTDFSHYVHPHPNWFTMGANMRFFQDYGVKGVFEEGAYAGPGAEMAEMRNWVLAQLLWNPRQDDRRLIREFLEGYFGPESAKPIYDYLELLHGASKDFYLGCFLRKDPPPYLSFPIISQADRLWQLAEKDAANDREKLTRVRIGHLPIRSAFLKDWVRLRRDCWEQNATWPMNESRKAVAAEFKAVCDGIPGQDWTRVRTLNERGAQVEEFLKGFAEDPKLDVGVPPPVRLKHASPPPDLPGNEWKQAIDLQENVAGLFKPGEYAEILPDLSASDHRAVRMPGSHSEWAFRISGRDIEKRKAAGRYKLYVIVRVEKSSTPSVEAPAFVAGVYDTEKKDYPAQRKVSYKQATEGYRSWLVGEFDPGASRDIFVAPASHPGIKAVWVDRICLVPSAVASRQSKN